MTQTWDAGHTNAGMTLSGGNLTATATGSSYLPFFAATGVSSGKLYWELTASVASGSSNVGIGNISSSAAAGQWLGIGTDTIGWYPGSGIWNGGVQVASWGVYTNVSTPQLLGFSLDLVNNKIWGRVGAAGNWNNDIIANQDPANNLGGLTVPTGVLASLVVPGACGFTTGDIFVGVFAAASWTGTAPVGFSAFDSTTINAWHAPTVSFWR